MADEPRSEPKKEEGGESFDLAERLAKYRSRLAREGRRSALERLDREIEEASRPRKAH